MGRSISNRGRGISLNDAERVARHYGISVEDARGLLAKYSVAELLPGIGYGLTRIGANPDGYLWQDPSFWWFFLGFSVSIIMNFAARDWKAV